MIIKRLLSGTLLMLFLCCCCNSLAAAPAPGFLQNWNNADKEISAGNYAAARDILLASLPQAPSQTARDSVHLAVADTWVKEGRLDDALSAYAVVASDEKSGIYRLQARYTMGSLLFKSGKPAEAAAEFERVLALRNLPSAMFYWVPEAGTRLIEIYTRRRDSARALEIYAMMQQMLPTESKYRLALAFGQAGLLESLKRPEEAIAIYRRIMQADFGDDIIVRAGCNLGLLYAKLDMREEARKAFLEARSKSPASAVHYLPSALLALAGMSLEEKDYPAATNFYREVLGLEGTRADYPATARLGLARTLFLQGDRAAARSELEKLSSMKSTPKLQAEAARLRKQIEEADDGAAPAP